MSEISLETENKIEEMVSEIRKTARVGSPIVVIITKDKVIINPEMDKKNKNYTYAFGLGFQAGRNDLYNDIYGKGFIKDKTLTI